MSPWKVMAGRQYLGRVLAHDEEHAKKQARGIWPAYAGALKVTRVLFLIPDPPRKVARRV